MHASELPLGVYGNSGIYSANMQPTARKTRFGESGSCKQAVHVIQVETLQQYAACAKTQFIDTVMHSTHVLYSQSAAHVYEDLHY